MNDTTVWCQNPSVTEPRRDGGGVADGEGKSWREYPLSPASRELSQRESLKIRASLGVWALPEAFCNTKAKLAIKQNDK